MAAVSHLLLTLLFWNARSLLRKTNDFKMFIDELGPSVIGVCETWLQPSLSFRLRGYTLFREDRPQRVGGGLAVMIRDTIRSRQLTLAPFPGGVLETLAVQVELSSGWISLLIAYNPCKHVTSNELSHFTGQLPSPALLLGDLNARHGLWDPGIPSSSVNSSGSSVFNFLLHSTRFTLLSPAGLGTRVDPHTGSSSVLDVCVGDPYFMGAEFSLGPFMGSDHLPLIVKYPDLTLCASAPICPRWRMVNGNWPVYEEALSLSPPESGLPLLELVGSFSEWLLDAGHKAFRLVTERAAVRGGVPWWKEECKRAVRDRRSAWNQWCKCLSLDNMFNYKRFECSVCACACVCAA